LEILNVKVEKETKEKLERLVKTKGYRNKSEALRKVIEEHFEEHPELFAEDEIQEALKQADEMSEAEFERLASEVFKGHRKTAAKLVAEGRDR
jgi:Arc/MetJ-type ribon-helix-helix transcriptional regulator